MEINETTRQIAEYGRILSQLLCDVIEHNYLTETAAGLLTKTQFTILKILSVSGPYTISEIADILHISRAAASKNIDKLVNSHFVTRKIIKEDRRTMEVSLSKAGKSLVDKNERTRLRKQHLALSHFSETDKQSFLNLLKDYVKNSVAQEKNIELICLQCNGVIGKDCSLNTDEDNCRLYYKLKKKYITIEEED